MNWMDRLTEFTDLPGENLPGLPLLELAGDSRILIENHCGISAYGRECIHIRVRYGRACICGAGLELACMTKNQLVITGRIDSITVLRGDEA